MNIEEKTKLADSYFQGTMSYIRKFDIKHNFLDVVAESWEYADAMEAEAEKRIKAKAEKDAEESKVFFEELTKNKIGSCKHITTSLDGTWCFDCGGKLNMADSPQLEWQPDWSQSPNGALTWAMSSDKNATWAIYDENGNHVNTVKAPSFNYQGDWKDSLRKRPK